MAEQRKKLYDRVYEGIPVPNGFSIEAFRSAMDYKPKSGDIFIVTYPKCGTTWMHHIVLLILRRGKLSNDPLDFFLGCPFLEMTGADAVDKLPSPRAMKTHLPYSAVPMSKDAKYIYVTRNAKDCTVSYYHHMKSVPSSDYKKYASTFDEFFEFFVNGDLPYGDYFDHLIEWYEHRNDPNVYIVTYEALKNDPKGEIMKLARFLGEEYEKILMDDPDVLNDVVRYSSIGYMKKGTNDVFDKFLKGEITASSNDGELPSGMKQLIEVMRRGDSPVKSVNFVRKGIVGDWKNHFNDDQVKRLEEKLVEKSKKSDFMNLWE